MNDLRTAAQQALEALEAFLSDELRPYEAAKTSDALRAALAQQAEPVEPVESALQAVAEKIGDQCAVWYGIGARDVEAVLREAARYGLVHGAQAEPVEPVAAERERCAEYLMQQAAECRENSPTRVTLESCAAVLRLELVEWVAQQAEPVEPVALKHRHEWFRTGGMEPGQFRCIHCGVWGQEQSDPQIEDRLARHGIPMPEGDNDGR